MSDISITRFQPASVTREKVNAVTPTQNDGGGLGSGGGQHTDQEQHESGHARPPLHPDTQREERDDLEEAVASLNAYVQRVRRDILFDLDGEDEPTVTVVDRSSRKVLRHINGDEARKLARRADDDEDFTLFDARV